MGHSNRAYIVWCRHQFLVSFGHDSNFLAVKGSFIIGRWSKLPLLFIFPLNMKSRPPCLDGNCQPSSHYFTRCFCSDGCCHIGDVLQQQRLPTQTLEYSTVNLLKPLFWFYYLDVSVIELQFCCLCLKASDGRSASYVYSLTPQWIKGQHFEFLQQNHFYGAFSEYTVSHIGAVTAYCVKYGSSSRCALRAEGSTELWARHNRIGLSWISPILL